MRIRPNVEPIKVMRRGRDGRGEGHQYRLMSLQNVRSPPSKRVRQGWPEVGLGVDRRMGWISRMNWGQMRKADLGCRLKRKLWKGGDSYLYEIRLLRPKRGPSVIHTRLLTVPPSLKARSSEPETK